MVYPFHIENQTKWSGIRIGTNGDIRYNQDSIGEGKFAPVYGVPTGIHGYLIHYAFSYHVTESAGFARAFIQDGNGNRLYYFVYRNGDITGANEIVQNCFPPIWLHEDYSIYIETGGGSFIMGSVAVIEESPLDYDL